MNKELKEYRKSIEYLAKERIDSLLQNSGPEHALIIFENIFTCANNEIRIHAKDLCNEEVTSKFPYVSSLISFLDKAGTKLKIMLTDFDNAKAKNSILFDELRTKIAEGKDIEIRSAAAVFRIDNGNQVHFCIGDNCMYRLETDINERKAIGNFNDENKCNTLIHLFDTCFNKSNKITL